jgi:AcrR family transcriptional regulator
VPRWNNSLQTNQEIQRLKREAVLREAGKAFGKRGYHNTSLDDVARALQVSKGTLYNYVKDKQEILYECHSLALDIGDRAFAHGRSAGSDGAGMLRHTLVRYIELLTEELGACAVLMEVDAMKPEDRDTAVARRDAFERDFVKLIRLGMQDGSIRSVDPKLAVFTFMGAINWLPRWFSPEGRLSGSEIAATITDILLSGLVRDPAHFAVGTTDAAAKPSASEKRRKRVAATRARA